MRFQKRNACFITSLVFLFSIFVNSILLAQSVQIGNGSYTVELPDGQLSALDENGNSISPNIGGNFTKLEWFSSYVPVTTNDFWSSTLFRYSPEEPSYIHAHPFQLNITSTGVTLGYANQVMRAVTGSNFLDDYTYFTEGELSVGLLGVTESNFKATDYSDWTATTTWTTDSTSLEVTYGHGLPFVYITIDGAEIVLSSEKNPSIWHQDGNVLGVSIDGKYFGIFAPSGTQWNSEFPLQSNLNDKDFLSIAILPDSSISTFNFFKNHAYAFIDETEAIWNFNPETNQVNVSYEVSTTLMDDSESHVNNTLQALYKHQWLHTNNSLTNFSYVSPRGTLKVFEGNSFSTSNTFIGILPFLPDLGNYNRTKLLQYLNEGAIGPLSSSSSSYDSGKEMGKYAQLIHIADQLSDLKTKNSLLDELKIALESWLTAGGTQQYFYDEDWKALIGFPASHGSNTSLNDQHFHHGYAIFAASTIAKFDSTWAAQENWGGMINLLIKNASNWDKTEKDFPYLRNFDIYAGHSWANGHAAWFLGNNQESSSESMNYAASTFLWGEITGQDEIRDLGAYLYTIESEAIEQYWFDIDNDVFPESFDHKTAGMITGAGAIHGTWFSSNIEMIHGINFLPITSGSLYLGKHPNYIINNYNEILETRGSDPLYWKDILWSYLALSDAELALNHFESDTNYEIFDGDSKARTMHWLHNLKVLGHIDSEVQADVPSYNVFVNSNNDTTYIAYNPHPFTKKVTFTNGFSFDVPAKETMAFNRSMSADTVGKPTAIPIFESLNVLSIFSEFYEAATGIILKNDSSNTTSPSFKSVAGNNVILLEHLDEQHIEFASPLDISTRTHLFSNIWSFNGNGITISLTQGENISAEISLELSSDEWMEIQIDMANFDGTIDITQIDGMIIKGNETIVIDDLLFYGNTPVKEGPEISAEINEYVPENIISIFSDKFENIQNTNFTPDQDQTTEVSFFMVHEDSTLQLKNLDHHFISFESNIDASSMVKFHFNYWTQETENLSISLLNENGNEASHSINVKKHTWQRIELSLADVFSNISLNEISHLKFDGDGTIFIDNIFFYKYPEITEAPAPELDPEYVFSLFSDTYTEYREAYPIYSKMNETMFSAPHDASTVEVTDINGNNVLYYDNGRYAIVEFFKGISADGVVNNGIDGSKFTNIRFDFYTQDEVSSQDRLEYKLVDFGGDAYGGGNDTEDSWWFTQESNPKLESHKWITVDIPLDDLPNMTSREHLSQMLLFAIRGDIKNYYIDNLYFYSDEIINSNDDEHLDIPKTLNLYQNYPNPFNPSTNIQFSIPKTLTVSLTIFNAIGQKVATLIDSQLSPGTYTMTWDASRVSSGVYFYQLNSNGNVQTKQMLLIK